MREINNHIRGQSTAQHYGIKEKLLVPTIFHAAANCPKNDNHEIGRLFMIACRSKIPPWKAITKYLDASYPLPVFPPVLRRMITWISWASEKSTLVVTAHCNEKQKSMFEVVVKLHALNTTKKNTQDLIS